MVVAALTWSLVSALLCFNVDVVTTKYVKGHIITSENWAFVARFCFLSEEGKFEYKIEYEKEYGVQNLLLYYDSSNQWPAVYHSNKTCEQKEAVLSIQLNQIINLTETRLDERCKLRPPTPKSRPFTYRSPTLAPPPHQVVECHDARRFRSARERWWFLAVSNCNGTKGLNLEYEFRMTNGRPGDYWHEHFSADEFYILPSLTFFTIAYMLMIIAVVICTVELKARHLLHATYKLFVMSVLLQEAGILVQSIAYLRYANDGIGYPRIRQLGRLLEAASETTFMLLLLLLAKGYTVTRARLRLASSVKLTIFMCAYTVTYAALFIYEREFFDPGEVLYLYESPAGYGLMGLRILAWWMFVYSTVFTLKHYPEKAHFYYPFNLVATLWFVVGPCFILSANSLIDKWVRESIVFAVLHAVAFCGHLQFLLLTRPAKANKNFPYHVRTSQIGVMEVSGGVAGNSNLYRFGRHAYAPGNAAPLPAEWLTEVPVELFAVSRSVAVTTRQIAAPFAVTLPPRAPALPALPPRPRSPLTASLSSSISLSPPSSPPPSSPPPPSPPPKYMSAISSNSLPVLRPLGITGQDLAGGEARVGDSHGVGGASTDGPRSGPPDRPKDPSVFIAHCERVSTA